MPLRDPGVSFSTSIHGHHWSSAKPQDGPQQEEGCLCKRFLEAYPWSPLGVKSIPGVPGVHAPNFLLLEGEGTKVSASESGIFAKPKISWLLGLENEWLLKTGSCNF